MEKPRIEDILEFAMDQEREANRFYTDAAAATYNVSAKETFVQLAAEERGHLEILTSLRHDPSLKVKFTAPTVDFKIAETEATPPLSTDMAPKDAIALAMKKEQKAAELYHALAALAQTLETKTVYENLANMELAHKNRLETIFVDIGYPEVF